MTRKVRIVFLVSIVLNLLLAGVMFGRIPQQFYGGPPERGRFRAEVEKLPEPARSRFREKLDDLRHSGLRDQIRATRQEAIRVLGAERFDEEAYNRQIGKMNELRMQMSRRIADNVRDIVKDLPVEQRRAVAELFKRSR